MNIIIHIPEDIAPEDIQIIETAITTELSHTFAFPQFALAVTEEMYGRTSITIHTEISITQYEVQRPQLIRTMISTAAPLFQVYSALACLVMRIDISDDKIAVSSEYIMREHLLRWYEHHLADEELEQYVQSYW